MIKSKGIQGVLLASAAVVVYMACGKSNSSGPDTTKRDIEDAEVPLTASSAAAGATKALNGETFTVSSSVLASNASTAALTNALNSGEGKTSISFSSIEGANGNITMTNPTATGTVKFASCTFTVATPANLAGSIFIKTCAIKVTATAVTPGDPGTQGAAVLDLNGVRSEPVSVDVSLGTDRRLEVNGQKTPTVLPPLSGSGN